MTTPDHGVDLLLRQTAQDLALPDVDRLVAGGVTRGRTRRRRARVGTTFASVASRRRAALVVPQLGGDPQTARDPRPVQPAASGPTAGSPDVAPPADVLRPLVSPDEMAQTIRDMTGASDVHEVFVDESGKDLPRLFYGSVRSGFVSFRIRWYNNPPGGGGRRATTGAESHLRAGRRAPTARRCPTAPVCCARTCASPAGPGPADVPRAVTDPGHRRRLADRRDRIQQHRREGGRRGRPRTGADDGRDGGARHQRCLVRVRRVRRARATPPAGAGPASRRGRARAARGCARPARSRSSGRRRAACAAAARSAGAPRS